MADTNPPKWVKRAVYELDSAGLLHLSPTDTIDIRAARIAEARRIIADASPMAEVVDMLRKCGKHSPNCRVNHHHLNTPDCCDCGLYALLVKLKEADDGSAV